MHAIIVWVLVMTGPHPHFIKTYPTHAQCIQARYDLGYTKPRKRENAGVVVCKPQTIMQERNGYLYIQP
jgi:hypothetical protein